MGGFQICPFFIAPLWKRVFFVFGLLTQIGIWNPAIAKVSSQPVANLKISFGVKEKHYVNKISNTTLPLSVRITSADTLISICLKSDSLSKSLFYELQKAKICMDEGEYLMSFENYRFVLDKVSLLLKQNSVEDKENLHQYKLESLLQMGKCSRNMGLYEESTRYLFDLLKVAKVKKEDNYIVKTLSFLGGVFSEIGNRQMAEKYHTLALKAIDNNVALDNDTKFSVYNNYAGMYYQKGQYDSALYYVLKSHDYVLALGDKRREASYLNNLALLYENFKEDELAKDCLFQALQLATENKLCYTRGITLQGIARYYERQNQYKLAQDYYSQSIDLATTYKMLKLKSASLRSQAELLYKQGKYIEAYQTLELSYLSKDSVLNEQNAEKIMLYSNRYENGRMQAENKILQQDLLISSLQNERKKILLFIFIGLILIITFFTFKMVQKLKKQNEANETLHIKISSDKEKSSQIIGENTRKFTNLLEEKNRKLTSKALVIAQTQEQLNGIKECMQKCKETKDEQEKNTLLKEMENALGRMELDKGWDEFKLFFEQVNGDFYEKLFAISPELTKTEQRICALLALNLTAKEIASITNRSVRTIETFNYRIRKKLKISLEEKTTHFLSRLLG